MPKTHRVSDIGFEAAGWVGLAVLAFLLFWNGILPAVDEAGRARSQAETERARTAAMKENRDTMRLRVNQLEEGDDVAEKAALLRQGYAEEGHIRLLPTPGR